MSGNPSAPSAWDSQHQPKKSKKSNRKRKKEELEHHEAQVNQQLQAQNGNKLILHQQESKAQVTEQQQHMQPPRPATLKLLTPAVPLVLNVAQIQNFGRPPYTAMPGVHNYLAQPGWPGQGMPFVPQF